MKKLLEVKKEIGVISKTSTNPFFKSEYMDLNQLLTHVEPILIEKGLLLTQPIEEGCVVSRITDVETGESVESKLTLLSFIDAQKVGSCITYYRRYTLKSLLAIAEVDNDGNDITKAQPKKKPAATDANLKKAKEQKATIQMVLTHYTLTKEQINNY